MMLGNHKNSEDKYEMLKSKMFIALPDILGIIGYFIFYIYWSRLSEKTVIRLKNKFKQISDRTI